MKKHCLWCESEGRRVRVNGLFCTKRCAAKWAIVKADAEQDWCDIHGWHRAGVCELCETLLLFEEDTFAEIEDEENLEEEEWPEMGWCPKCRNADNLVPQLQFFYIEEFDDGLGDAHGRIFFEGWHCTYCQEHYWSADIYDGHYDDYEKKSQRRWQEAWRKLGVDHITISCAGSKPSFHRVLETAPARQLSSGNEVKP